ncbi:hypothetical protein KEM54_005924 [Ascosphaera aggregata]|nr:hypothetical protein KEM54_005924 [Ascosphaera aggregata]
MVLGSINRTARSENGLKGSEVNYENHPSSDSDTPQHRLLSMRSHENAISNKDTPGPYVAYNPSSSKERILAPESTARWLLSLVYPCLSREHGAYTAAVAADSSRQKNDSSSSSSSSSTPSFVQRMIPFPSVDRSRRKSSSMGSAIKYRNAPYRKIGLAEKSTAMTDQGEEIATQLRDNHKEVTPKPSASESKIPMEPQPQPQLQPAQAAQVPEISSPSYAWRNNEVDLLPVASQLHDTWPYYSQQQCEQQQQQQQQRDNGQQQPMNSQHTQCQKMPTSSEAQEDGAGQPSSSISSAILSIIHNDPPPGKGISLREKEIGSSCLGLVISVVFAIILF